MRRCGLAAAGWNSRFVARRGGVPAPLMQRHTQASTADTSLRSRARAVLHASLQPAATLALASVMTVTALFLLFRLFREPIRASYMESTAEVTSRVMNDPNVKRDFNGFTSNVVRTTLRDNDCITEVVGTLQRLIGRGDVQDEFKTLALRTLKDPRTVDGTKRFLTEVFGDDWMQDNVSQIAVSVSKRALADEEVRSRAREWLSDVVRGAVRDPALQAEVGVCLWASALHGLGVRRLTGVTRSDELLQLRQSNMELADRLRAQQRRGDTLEQQLIARVERQLAPSAE
eukprot:TRINITY_DN4731_c0_g1_i1.p1 TRINITY_DN4731_c0_g1~~TRINITY_DN4731_c0_g1_i1.p1  ORF type:complete len:287 (+),score=55.97 TRINITY_DN4731_c0_g1_i1:85-945(+)